MPNYSFDNKQGKSSEKTHNGKNIPVEDGNIYFNVGKPGSILNEQEIKAKSQKVEKQNEVSSSINAPTKKNATPRPTGKLVNKIWHALEFIAVTSVIFMVLFFALNFDSYSRLFLNKLDQLRGNINDNPYEQQELAEKHNASLDGQQPLPIVNTLKAAKQQIPELTLNVAPPDDRVIINRINQNVPVIRVPTDMLIKRDWAALEQQIQDALRHGVVHFPGTAMPGDDGNVVITGHSSYFPWDPGRFKDVFALLHQVSVGDEIVVYHEQQKYIYKVYDKKVVEPDQVEVLTQEGEDRLTLLTCTPVGTNLRRLVILAEPR